MGTTKLDVGIWADVFTGTTAWKETPGHKVCNCCTTARPVISHTKKKVWLSFPSANPTQQIVHRASEPEVGPTSIEVPWQVTDPRTPSVVANIHGKCEHIHL